MTKFNKHSVRFAAAGLAATLLVGACAISATIRPQADSYTVEYNDGYYSQTTYYLTEEAYNEHLDKTSAKTGLNSAGATKSAAAAKVNTSPSSGDDGEFVMAAAKTVWVAEKFDENGNVTASELLTKEQMDDYGISPMGLINNKFNQDSLFGGGGGGGYPDEEIGTIQYKTACLTIDLTVTYNDYTKLFTAKSNANWEENWTLPWEGSGEAESFVEDYMALTWGGERTLEAQSHLVSGKYYSGTDVTF